MEYGLWYSLLSINSFKDIYEPALNIGSLWLLGLFKINDLTLSDSLIISFISTFIKPGCNLEDSLSTL